MDKNSQPSTSRYQEEFSRKVYVLYEEQEVISGQNEGTTMRIVNNGLSKLAYLRQEKKRYKSVQFSSSMTASDVDKVLRDSFEMLHTESFRLASVDKNGNLSSHEEGNWSGKNLRKWIKGKSCLHILTKERVALDLSPSLCITNEAKSYSGSTVTRTPPVYSSQQVVEQISAEPFDKSETGTENIESKEQIPSTVENWVVSAQATASQPPDNTLFEVRENAGMRANTANSDLEAVGPSSEKVAQHVSAENPRSMTDIVWKNALEAGRNWLINNGFEDKDFFTMESDEEDNDDLQSNQSGCRKQSDVNVSQQDISYQQQCTMSSYTSSNSVLSGSSYQEQLRYNDVQQKPFVLEQKVNQSQLQISHQEIEARCLSPINLPGVPLNQDQPKYSQKAVGPQGTNEPQQLSTLEHKDQERMTTPDITSELESRLKGEISHSHQFMPSSPTVLVQNPQQGNQQNLPITTEIYATGSQNLSNHDQCLYSKKQATSQCRTKKSPQQARLDVSSTRRNFRQLPNSVPGVSQILNLPARHLPTTSSNQLSLPEQRPLFTSSKIPGDVHYSQTGQPDAHQSSYYMVQCEGCHQRSISTANQQAFEQVFALLQGTRAQEMHPLQYVNNSLPQQPINRPFPNHQASVSEHEVRWSNSEIQYPPDKSFSPQITAQGGKSQAEEHKGTTSDVSACPTLDGAKAGSEAHEIEESGANLERRTEGTVSDTSVRSPSDIAKPGASEKAEYPASCAVIEGSDVNSETKTDIKSPESTESKTAAKRTISRKRSLQDLEQEKRFLEVKKLELEVRLLEQVCDQVEHGKIIPHFCL